MTSFTYDALQLIWNYVKNVKTELGKIKVGIEHEYLKIVLFDLENYIKILSIINAMKRKSSKVEVFDVERALKKYGKPEEFIKSHFKDVKTYLDSQRVTVNNLRFMKDQLEKTKMPKVLDAGCGWGRISKKLNDHFCGKFETIGVDLRKLSLRLGKTINKAADFVVSDIRALPFKGQTFDLILCSDVIHEMKSEKDRHIAAQEFSRVSKPKAMLHITDKFTKLRIISTLTRVLQHIGKVEWISRKDQLEKTLQRNGFRIINLEKTSSHFYGLITAYTFMEVETRKP